MSDLVEKAEGGIDILDSCATLNDLAQALNAKEVSSDEIPVEANNDIDEEGDENSSSNGDDVDSEVQLGFVEKSNNPMFMDPDWRNWDGGKIGGRPVSFVVHTELVSTQHFMACIQ